MKNPNATWARIGFFTIIFVILAFSCNGPGNQPNPSSSDASLSMLALSESSGGAAIALTPAFSSSETTYAASVLNTVSSVALSYATTNSGATTAVTGNPTSLAVGENAVSVKVTAADGTTTKTYVVTITRAALDPENANLGSLSVSQGTLSPDFSAGTTSYSVSVPYAVSTITLSATAADSGASVSGDGDKSLVEGANTLDILVTAANHTTTKTYTIVVTRATAATADATLSSLSVAGYSIAPAFDPATTDYSLSVPNGISTVTIAATASSASATKTGDGAKSLSVGPNVFNIDVTSADASTTITYTLTVTRGYSTNANLASLTVGPGNLSPAFSASVHEYDVSIAYGVSSITLSAAAADTGAAIAGTGVKNPEAGKTTDYPIVVTAADGTTKLTYTVHVARAAQSTVDANLSALSVAEGSISPAFDPATTSYSLSVSNETTSAAISATTAQASASKTGDGAKSLSVGANVFSIIVTASDGTTKKTYTLTITRRASSNASLASLTVGPGSLSPAFSASTRDYSVSLAYGVSSITISATAADSGASIAGTGDKYPVPGETTDYPVVVTAADGATKLTYTVHVARAAQSTVDASLSALSVTGYSITPAFDSATTSYSLSVPNGISEVNIAATTAQALATKTGDGIKSLAVGANTCSIVVTAPDGTTKKTYTIAINRQDPLSANADLATLSVTPGSLSPAFAASTTSYDVSVPYAVSSIAISATAYSGATVAGTGDKPLVAGSNQFQIVVTAAAGNFKTYTITVTRASESTTDAMLKSLSVAGYSITPAFDPSTTAYSLNVPYGTSSATISAEAANASATLTGAGAKALSVGANACDIVVTAADTTTKKTYTLTITRAAQSTVDANLSALSVAGYSISPAFNPATTSYSLSVPFETTSATISATTAQASATKTGDGAKSLTVGANAFSIEVTAPDGTTKKTYSLTITRLQSANANLASLTVTPGSLSPSFSASVHEYNVSVVYGATSVSIGAAAADAGASLTGTGTFTPAAGATTDYSVVVTAADGTTKLTYTIHVARAAQTTVDANLSALSVTSYSISPAFDSATTSYTLSVPNAVSEVNIAATTAQASATKTGDGIKSLSTGLNSFSIVVTAPDGTTKKTYTIAITRQDPPSTNANLASLSVSTGSLTPAFAAATTTYSVSLPYATTSITIAATAADSGATVNGTGTKINLVEGSNQYEIIVTAAAGNTKTYTVTVTRAAQATTDATLSALSVTGYSITPAFDSATTSYSLTVPNGILSATIVATTTQASATKTGDGAKSLSEGANAFSIEVTASDGTTKKTYALTITRSPLSTNANLASLTVTPGSLSPSFSASVHEYDVSVVYGATSVSIGAAAADTGASLTGTGTFTPAAGATTDYTVTVTAAAGNTQTYTLHVARAAQSTVDANLSALSVTGYAISPAFDSATTSYSLSVPNGISAVNIAATTSQASATKTGDGIKSLNVGLNSCPIEVTAPDGTTKKTYTIAITRQDPPSTNANLASLSVSTGSLTPAFAAATTAYSVSVPYATTSITIAATAADSGAGISGTGTMSLLPGANIISIQVTAAAGNKLTYTVTVNRAAETTIDATLSALSVTGRTISPAFNSATTSYTASVPNDVTSATIVATTTNASATKIGDGDKTLSLGDNSFSIVVTSADGSTTKTYTIVINRSPISVDASLNLLNVYPGTLAPLFSATTYEYNVSLTNTAASIAITATATDSGATVAGTGTFVPAAGATTNYSVVVTAAAGNKLTYVIHVARAGSADSILTALTLSGRTLGGVDNAISFSPAFQSNQFSYTASVDWPIATITPTATLANAASTMSVNQTWLTPGSNTITIHISAEDGTSSTYSIAVTRAAAPSSVTVTSPAENATISGSSVTLSGTVTGSTTTQVEIQLDSPGSTAVSADVSGGAWSTTIDVSGTTNGSKYLLVTPLDADYNVTGGTKYIPVTVSGCATSGFAVSGTWEFQGDAPTSGTVMIFALIEGDSQPDSWIIKTVTSGMSQDYSLPGLTATGNYAFYAMWYPAGSDFSGDPVRFYKSPTMSITGTTPGVTLTL
jgi:hypothetical protein